MRHTLFAAALVPLALATAPAQADLRILVFGDSNSWGWRPVGTGFPTTRYDDRTRWPGVMETWLETQTGEEVTVVVDALSGRTVATAYPAPAFGLPGAAFSGAGAFRAALARELPLDVVVVMLGTNDARSDLAVPPASVGAGIGRLIDTVATLDGGVATGYPAPRLLVVAPPPVGDVSATPIAGVMQGGAERSRAIATAIVAAARAAGTGAFDAAQAVPQADGVDGVHLSPAAHAALGSAIGGAVLPLVHGGAAAD